MNLNFRGFVLWQLAIFVSVLWGLGAPTVLAQEYVPGQKSSGDFESFGRPFLAQNGCLDCHGATEPEGNFSLVDLGPVDEVNANTWKTIWAQVTLKEMPPHDAEQPDVVERLRFSDWVVEELQQVLKDKGGFHAPMDPHKANFVDHELLFGKLPPGIRLKPTSSPARLWRVSPQEHMTRLNELINREPDFDPAKSGRRTRGDAVPTNHGGELKIYFGTDRILRWQGGTVAYATAVKSLPAILSSARDHGLKNYPDFYSVNSAEATQILNAAQDIIQYMAYGPLSIANPEQITDNPNSYKMEGDIRGLPTSIVYSTKIKRPLTPVYELMNDESRSDSSIVSAVKFLFEALTFRPPTDQETNTYLNIVKQSINKLGKEEGVQLGLSAIFLDRDALFRPELAENGTRDDNGRVMLQDWELGLAVNHAFAYIQPDSELRVAIESGRMQTREDVKREVQRILNDDRIRKPRILQFFRDYFDYDRGGYVCKDTKALAETGASTRGQNHYRAMFDGAASTDRLVEHVLASDRDVLRQLLTTQDVVATNADRVYFGRVRTQHEIRKAVAEAKQRQAENKQKLKKRLEVLEKELTQLQADIAANEHNKSASKHDKKELARKKKEVSQTKNRLRQANRKNKRGNLRVESANLKGPKVLARVSRRSFGNGSMKPERILAKAPAGQRLGILTHPSWLVSHSDAMDNHAIRRGKWIRERLLGGGIPDVPITVDAMLPDEPKKSLRDRMRVTRQDYCWTCHKKMDPLGLPFEMYNHAGLYRTLELNKPVDTSGEVIESGVADLDGEVSNAIELIEKLANSRRAEQVFVRYAFRFWMGRNETINDAPVLQAAHRAYRESGGSMKALLISLLTSDAFLYRVRE